MVSLIAKSPLDGLVPVTEGTMVLEDASPARVTSVMPLAGAAAGTAAALQAMGLGWPDPNRGLHKGRTACLWSGRGQAFLIDADPAPLAASAALTDQTDGWAVLSLSGPGAAAALARLVSIDLRPSAFAPGHVARTPLNHMMALLECTGPEAFRIFVFRSMALSAVHELHQAMASVAARSHL